MSQFESKQVWLHQISTQLARLKNPEEDRKKYEDPEESEEEYEDSWDESEDEVSMIQTMERLKRLASRWESLRENDREMCEKLPDPGARDEIYKEMRRLADVGTDTLREKGNEIVHKVNRHKNRLEAFNSDILEVLKLPTAKRGADQQLFALKERFEESRQNLGRAVVGSEAGTGTEGTPSVRRSTTMGGGVRSCRTQSSSRK